MRYVCRFAVFLPLLSGQALLSAQDGAAIYKDRCASCHDMPQARVPSLAAIKTMSPEAIYTTLTNGLMKSRADGLSTPEIFALIGYIAPTGGAHPDAPPLPRLAKAVAPFGLPPARHDGTDGARR